MISDKEYREMWEQANLARASIIEANRKEIAKLEAEKLKVSSAKHKQFLLGFSRTKLAEVVRERGSDARKLAGTGSKDQLADYLIDCQKTALESRIAELQREIEKNQQEPGEETPNNA